METEAAAMVMNQRKNLEDYALVLSDKDNVATALVDLPAGDYMLGSSAGEAAITVPEDIRAGFKDGILTITIPRSEENPPRQIAVDIE